MAIDWKPFSPKSIDFLENSNARLNILHGAVRSAKTIACTVRWLTFMVFGPPGDLAMLGKTTATLQRNVLNDLLDIVGPENYKWVNRQQGELKIFDRRVYCFGANNEDAESKIRGATFAGALCDEVSLYPQSVFNQLMARLSIEGACCFCNTNPDSPYHWFYTEYITNDAIQDKKIWQFYMEDNLSLSEDYIKSLKQMYRGVWYDRMIKGEWVAAEGRIYDMFLPKTHLVDGRELMNKLIKRYNIHPRAIRYTVGCDYGTSTVMSWGLYASIGSAQSRISITIKLREYYYDAQKAEQQKTDGEFADEFAKWLIQDDGKTIVPQAVYCDPSAASWKLQLMRRGYRVLNADNDVINGIRYVSTRLANATELADDLSNLATDSFYIDKSCTNTEREYASYTWDTSAQVKGVDKPLKYRDHTCDTDRYALYTDSRGALTGVYGVK